MSQSKNISIAQRDGVMRIGINRPEKKNALTTDMYDAMRAAFIEANKDTSIKSVLLHGADGVFCAGNDLGDFDKRDFNEPSPASLMLFAMHECRKPVVAAVPGVAVGIGTTMLLHCDLVYAAPDIRFRMPFVDLGVCPEAGSSLLLPATVGLRVASEILLLGDFFSAEKASELGIVNAVIPADALFDHALEKALQLAQKPNRSLLETKRLLKKGDNKALEERMNEEFQLFAELLQTPESQQMRQRRS